MHQRNQNEKSSYCLICFKLIGQEISLTNLFSLNKKICDHCFKQFKVIDKEEQINHVSTWFLYEYNHFIKSLIYQYKGCYDLLLKDAFLDRFKEHIQKKYKNYTVIFPPSNQEEDFKRGFNHMQEIAKSLKLPYLVLFKKKYSYKQSSQSYKERINIQNVIQLNNNLINLNKKYLIIDDIYTSGSTLKTIISILIKKGIKKENIKAIIIAKTA